MSFVDLKTSDVRVRRFFLHKEFLTLNGASVF